MLVDAEVDLAALNVFDGLRRVRRDRARLRVRHQATGAQHLTEATDLAHELRHGDGRVEVGPAVGDALDELGAADLIRPGGDGGLSRVAVREDDDLGGLTRAVRQHDRATHHLVGLARVNRELQRNLDGRVELLGSGLLRQRDRVGGRVEPALFDLRGCGGVNLGLCHYRSPPQPSTVMPMERAVPATIFAAASMSFALRSGCLTAAISST